MSVVPVLMMTVVNASDMSINNHSSLNSSEPLGLRVNKSVGLGSFIRPSLGNDEPVLPATEPKKEKEREKTNLNNETEEIKHNIPSVIDDDDSLIRIDNYKYNSVDYYSKEGELLYRINKKPNVDGKLVFNGSVDDLRQEDTDTNSDSENNTTDESKDDDESLFDKLHDFIENLKKLIKFVIIPFISGLLAYFGRKVLNNKE